MMMLEKEDVQNKQTNVFGRYRKWISWVVVVDGCAAAEQGNRGQGLLLTNGRADTFLAGAGEASPFGGRTQASSAACRIALSVQ